MCWDSFVCILSPAISPVLKILYHRNQNFFVCLVLLFEEGSGMIKFLVHRGDEKDGDLARLAQVMSSGEGACCPDCVATTHPPREG